MKQPIFLIVTGLSGSGKSSAMKSIEDEGFFNRVETTGGEILMKRDQEQSEGIGFSFVKDP